MSGIERAERRATSRTRLQRLAFVRIEPDNGAIVVDASRLGIRFYAVAPLHQSGTITFSFSLSGNRRVEGTARLVWTDATKKSGGLEFISVPAEIIEQILDCCSALPLLPRDREESDSPPTQFPVMGPVPGAVVSPEREIVGAISQPPATLPEPNGAHACVAVELEPAVVVAVAQNIPPAVLPVISRVKDEHAEDFGSWRKWIGQMPLVLWLRAAPGKEKSPRNRWLSAPTALAFVFLLLSSLPILFVPKFGTKVVGGAAPVAVAQQQAPFGPFLPADAQRNKSAMTRSARAAALEAQSEETSDSETAEDDQDSAADPDDASHADNPEKDVASERAGSRSTPADALNADDSETTSGGRGRILNPGLDNGGAPAPVFPSANEDTRKTVQPLVILAKPNPVYTEEARRLGIQGEVVIDVVFSASGEVHVVRVVRGLGYGLDEAATTAAQQIRFQPALRDGTAVDVPATLHIQFQLAF